MESIDEKEYLFKSILIVDDEPNVRKSIGRALADAGFDVYLAECGEQALKIAEEYKPDIILLDRMMPIMDGYMVCKKLRWNPNTESLVIFMMTPAAGTPSVDDSFWAGADDYISKPISPASLLEQIEYKYQKTITKRNRDTRNKDNSGG